VADLPPLVLASDLTEYPGAPFADALVESASASVRADAGWHIAPVIEDTVTLDSDGGCSLMLPSLHVVEVLAVSDVTDADNPVVLSGWRNNAAGVLQRGAGFPAGLATVEVDVSHGYDECPGELLPVIAERCQAAGVNRTVSQEQSGQEMVSYVGGGPVPGSRMPRALRHYKLPARP
jgi:hypothetical protein